MYKSPITVFQSKPNWVQQMDDEIIYEIKMQVDVDKEELLKALAYDREQYEKGYRDAKEKYEKALDRACQLLQDIEKDNCVYCPLEDNLCIDDEERIYGHCKKEKWKAWLLREEDEDYED